MHRGAFGLPGLFSAEISACLSALLLVIFESRLVGNPQLRSTFYELGRSKSRDSQYLKS